MYAIIEQGSKQYKVSQGDRIHIELTDVKGEAETIELDKVLFVGDGEKSKIGNPFVEGAKVIGRFADKASEAITTGPKLYPQHFRRRKNSKKRTGHRQKYLQITIEKIEA